MWQKITAKIRKGKTYKDGAYRVAQVDEKGVTITRVATGSVVRISRAMVEKTAARLAAGERIPKRKISYTVAIEFLVVALLGDMVTLVDGEYVAA